MYNNIIDNIRNGVDHVKSSNTWNQALQTAHQNLLRAENQFDCADKDHIDLAIHRLNVARMDFDNALAEQKYAMVGGEM
jgi:hypothetical protein